MEKDKNLPPLPGSAYKTNDNISCVHNPSYAKILILPSRAYREIDRSFAWQPPAACYICGTVFDFPLSDETLVQLLWFNLRQNMSIGQSGQDPLSSLPVDFMPSLLPLLATCTPDICVLHEQDANPEQWPKPMFENIPSRLIVLRDKLEEIVEDPITSAVWEYTVEQARKSDGLVPRVMPSQPIGYGLSQSGG
jgi:hypothetical protein